MVRFGCLSVSTTLLASDLVSVVVGASQLAVATDLRIVHVASVVCLSQVLISLVLVVPLATEAVCMVRFGCLSVSTTLLASDLVSVVVGASQLAITSIITSITTSIITSIITSITTS